MAIRILNEISIDLDGETPALTLWLVAYGEMQDGDQDRWEMFITALEHFCGRQGWQLERGDDPYREKSLAIFAQGFSSPDSDLGDWEPDEEDV
jgi:hypothetical protein